MGGLLGTLNSSVDALRAFENALAVSQNNVSNANTPGYASQTATFEALPFQPNAGLTGGVTAGPNQSTDSQYADQAVRNATGAARQCDGAIDGAVIDSVAVRRYRTERDLGRFEQFVPEFFGVERDADLVGYRAIGAEQRSGPGAELSIHREQPVADHEFPESADHIRRSSRSTRLRRTIANENAAIQQTTIPDAGAEANLHASLESLAGLADVTVQFASNGTATVLLGGQTPLVIGSQQFNVQASFTDPTPGPNANAVPDAHILDSNGDDITSQISQGTLGRFVDGAKYGASVASGRQQPAGRAESTGAAGGGSREFDSDCRANHVGAAGNGAVHLQRGQSGGCGEHAGAESERDHRYAGADGSGSSSGAKRRGAGIVEPGQFDQCGGPD